MNLSDLKVGESCRVGRVTADGPGRRRLLDLGLVPGTVVQAIRRSPLGDPTAYAIRGATVALRVEQAATIEVEPLEATKP